MSRPDLKLLVLGFLGNVACIVEFEHDYEFRRCRKTTMVTGMALVDPD